MWNRPERPWRMARARMAWAWGLLTLMVPGFAPLAQAADAWAPIDGGQWGQVNSIAIDPGSPQGTVYIGASSGRAFKSTDGGASWNAFQIMDTNPQTSWQNLSGLVAYPAAPGTLTAKLTVYPFAFDFHLLARHYAYKSTDGGVSWTLSNWGGINNTQFTTVVMDPFTPSTLYAGMPAAPFYTGLPAAPIIGAEMGKLWFNGVFRSTNGGASWEAINNGLPIASADSVTALVIDPTRSGTLYAGIGSSVYKSTDGGASWALSATDGSNRVSAMVLNPAMPDTLYVATSGGGVFKTTDGGASWAGADAGLPYSHAIHTLILDPTAPGTVYAAAGAQAGVVFDGGVFKSTDGGASWTAVGTELMGTYVTALALNPATRTLFAGTRSGAFKHAMGANPVVLPNAGEPVALPLPGGARITASARQPGTQVQLAQTATGATIAMVTAGSALLQHSAAGQPLAGLPRSGGVAVLTPSCAAAQVLMTATGDTHTAVTQGCPVVLTGAGDALPTPGQGLSIAQGTIRTEDVQLYVTGPITRRSVLVSLNLDAMPRAAEHAHVYLIGLVPGALVGSAEPVLIERLPTGGWGPVAGPITALTRAAATGSPNAQVVVEIIKDGDLSGLVGTELYIGYGTSHEEMLQAGRYRALYRNE